MRLNEIQKNFKKTMIDPEHLDQNNEGFKDLFIDDKISLQNRMKVYRNNVIKGLSDTVISAYPILKKLTGEAFLKAATREYVLNNLPKKGNLNLYGDSFAHFLISYPPADKYPYLSDVAAFEWAFEKAYYAIDDTFLSPEELQTLNQEELPFIKLSFRDAVKLINSPYPLDEIYDFCNKENSDKKDTTLDISKKGAKIIVFRPEYTVQTRTLTDGEYSFLNALYNKKNILEAAQSAINEQSNFDLQSALEKFLKLRIFKKYQIDNLGAK